MHPYFRTAGITWRNAIRHNLSVNECFIRCGRAASGRGFNWYIHPGCVEMFRRGDFRRRELRRKVNEILQFSKTSNSYSAGLMHVNQSTMTPINQAAMTLAGRSTPMAPVNQTVMSPVYHNNIAPINQPPRTPVNQTAMTPVSGSYFSFSSSDQAQHSQYYPNTPRDGEYFQSSTPHYWTSTPKHYNNCSETSYS